MFDLNRQSLPLVGSPAMDVAALAVERLSKSFAGVRIPTDVDLVAQHGETHGLIGPNGSGKSTLVLASFNRP